MQVNYVTPGSCLRERPGGGRLETLRKQRGPGVGDGGGGGLWVTMLLPLDVDAANVFHNKKHLKEK